MSFKVIIKAWLTGVALSIGSAIGIAIASGRFENQPQWAEIATDVFSTIAAAVAGYLAGRWASRRPMAHAGGVAALDVVLSGGMFTCAAIIGALDDSAVRAATLVAVNAAAVMVGGWIASVQKEP